MLVNSCFFIFQISQGSVATYLRCGGKHDKDFIADFLLNQGVKNIWKSDNIF